MCGIVYLHDFAGNPVNNGILQQFDLQRHRGVEGFGLFDGQEGNIIRATTEDKILKWLCKYDSSLIMFHHRLPTSTINVKQAAHPFSTKDYFGNTQYILVHNGVISNSKELRKAHKKLGIKYQSLLKNGTFNDSEALLWDLSLYLEGKQDSLKIVGLTAFICVKLTDGELDKLYFGRNINPLMLFRTPKGIGLSSEGVGKMIDPHCLYTWNYKLKRLTDKYLSIPAYHATVPYYPNYNHPITNTTGTTHMIAQPDSDRWEYMDDRREDEYALADEKLLQESEDLALKYLITHKGVFEIAYTELEFDYMQIAEDCETREEYEQMRMFEEAMIYLELDREWVSEQSVSSTWTQLTLA